MRLSNKQRLVLVITIFGAALLGQASFAYYCLAERRELAKEMDDLDEQDRIAREKIAQIPLLNAKSQDLANIIEEYVTILPNESEVQDDAFLVDINRFARDAGLEVESGEPVADLRRRGRNEPAAQETFQQHKYRFSLQGTYLSLLNFVNLVENHTRFLRVDEISINPLGARENDTGLREVELAENEKKQIDLVVTTYTYSKRVTAGKEAK